MRDTEPGGRHYTSDQTDGDSFRWGKCNEGKKHDEMTEHLRGATDVKERPEG